MNTPISSVNSRHAQEEMSGNVFVDQVVERPATVEVVCSSARRRMDHCATYTSYRLFSHTLTIDPSAVPTWPERTDVCCWHCCHPFETVPISVPRMMSQSDKSMYYEVFGVFCSVNCAKKFVLERGSYDQQQLLLQLNEMCCSVFGISGSDVFTAKEAPPRYFLKMFGGSMDITEFRAMSLTTRTMLVMPPFVSHAMILEANAVRDASVSDTSEDTSSVVEPIREGQHMLRGLRRPTHPVPSESVCPTTSISRFDEFIKQKKASDGDGNVNVNSTTGGGVRPLRPVPKKIRKKENTLDTTQASAPSTTNTLNSFLMMRSTTE